MTPFRTLLSLVVLFAMLGVLTFIFPKNGIAVGPITLRFASFSSIFPIEAENSAQTEKEDPEKAIRKMMEEMRAKQFTAYADSLRFYEDFFKNGSTRFDFPDNDPTWLDHFFESIEKAKKDSAIIHIIHYGDSQIEEDRISATLRENMQSLFGGSGVGMLPAILEVPSMAIFYRSHGNLERHLLFGPESQEASHNRYGPMAQFSELNGKAEIFIQKHVRKSEFSHAGNFSQIRLLVGTKRSKFTTKLIYEREYEVQKDSMTETEIRKEKRRAIDPQIDTLGNLTVYTWKLPYTTSNAHISISGRAEIYTVISETPGGVSVDNVPMRGSSGTLFHRIDSPLLEASYKALNAKLIIMEYGGNLVPGSNAHNIDWTKKLITKQIQAIRKANPDADILFVGPADMAKQVNGKLQSYPSLERVIRALREVALENGAAYWDMHRVMGGKGSMIQWVQRIPPLAQKDHIHFSRSGAAYMGDLLFGALKMHFDYYQFRKAHDINAHKLEEIRSFADSTKASLKREAGKEILIDDDDTLIMIDLNTLQKANSNAQNVEGP